jgi:hypothetical protein
MCAERRRAPGPGEAGVTFLELTLALILGGLAMLGLGYVFGLDFRLWMQSHASVRLHAGAALALERIGREAGIASEFAMPAPNELHLAFPPSPLEDTLRHLAAYRVRDHILFRNGERLVPWDGDTAVGVDSLQSALAVDRRTGTRTLRVRLTLFPRLGPDMRADTVGFETAVHLRNEGSGTSSPVTSAVPGPGRGTL